MQHPRILLALTCVSILCAACGDSAERPGAPSDARAPHWRTVVSAGNAALTVLPDARVVTVDTGSDAPRLAAHLFATGAVGLEGGVGETFPLLADDEDLRLQAHSGLSARIVEVSPDPVAIVEGRAAPLPVLLHADREAPWRGVRELLAVLRNPVIGTRRLQWAVHGPGPATDRTGPRVESELRGAVDPEWHPLDIHIVADKGEGWTVVRIFAGGQIRSFGPQPAHLTDAAFLERANTTWNDLAGALTEFAKTYTAARIEVQDAKADVWIAYVLKTIDLVLDAGFEYVWLGEDGIFVAQPSTSTRAEAR